MQAPRTRPSIFELARLRRAQAEKEQQELLEEDDLESQPRFNKKNNSDDDEDDDDDNNKKKRGREEEEEEDDNNLDLAAAVVGPKRRIARLRVERRDVFDGMAAYLYSERFVKEVFKPRGVGHELGDLRMLLSCYSDWVETNLPSLTLEEFVERINKGSAELRKGEARRAIVELREREVVRLGRLRNGEPAEIEKFVGLQEEKRKDSDVVVTAEKEMEEEPSQGIKEAGEQMDAKERIRRNRELAIERARKRKEKEAEEQQSKIKISSGDDDEALLREVDEQAALEDAQREEEEEFLLQTGEVEPTTQINEEEENEL